MLFGTLSQSVHTPLSPSEDAFEEFPPNDIKSSDVSEVPLLLHIIRPPGFKK